MGAIDESSSACNRCDSHSRIREPSANFYIDRSPVGVRRQNYDLPSRKAFAGSNRRGGQIGPGRHEAVPFSLCVGGIDMTLPPTQMPGFATTAEAAEFLKVSKSLVNKLVAEGKVPARRYGRALRIPWAWLKAEAGV
jgi:excisionase family DNA binding protein